MQKAPRLTQPVALAHFTVNGSVGDWETLIPTGDGGVSHYYLAIPDDMATAYGGARKTMSGAMARAAGTIAAWGGEGEDGTVDSVLYLTAANYARLRAAAETGNLPAPAPAEEPQQAAPVDPWSAVQARYTAKGYPAAAYPAWQQASIAAGAGPDDALLALG